MIKAFPLLLLSLATLLPQVTHAQERRHLAAPRVVVDTPGERPVRISAARIEVRVTGTFAVTTLELSLYNPNQRVLEGSVEFPLREGQQVIGMASEVDGQLREAVAVEKAKGREVFEEVERARIDPALLEKTVGNNYRLRVYPIRPKGETRLAIRILENLKDTKSGLLFRLPLGFASDLKHLAVSIKVDDPGVIPTISSRGLGALALKPVGRFYEVAIERSRITKEAEVALVIPESSATRVYLGEHEGQQSFYAELPINVVARPRPSPKRLAIIWDASMSGANRKLDDEITLLKRYLAVLGNVEVTLHVLRNVLQAPLAFSVRHGDSNALRDVLRELVYDGATNFSALPKNLPADAALLFSDGIHNFGAGMVIPGLPVSVVSSALQADTHRLRRLASVTGGSFVDLSQGLEVQSLQALTTEICSIVRLDGEGVGQLVAQPITLGDRRIAIAGLIVGHSPKVSITLRGTHTKELRVEAKAFDQAPASPLTPRRWAQLRIDEMEAERDEYHAEILRLSQAHMVVSSETSLIVLDRVSDYVRHRIVPPPELRAAYDRELGILNAAMQKRRLSAVDQLLATWKARHQWWEKVFPKTRPPLPPEPVAEERDRERYAAQEAGRASSRDQGERARRTMAMAAPPPPSPAPMALTAASPTGDAALAIREMGVQIKKWSSDAPYIARMAAASADKLYAIYLDQRPSNANSSAFFLDTADLLFDKGQTDLASRVLSNLAEMQLENRDLLRVLASRLIQTKQPELAVPILKRVLEIAPDEPHSLRDLALAHAASGNAAEAVRLLQQLVLQDWDPRFGDIAEISLAELNALLAADPQLDHGTIDPRLIDNLPIALRVVLSWDNDNTDIDLLVKDPNGEVVSYANKLSFQGGRISRDVTSSYGPEEFILKLPKPGKYEIHANFYGHGQQVLTSATTVQAEITTGFGTPATSTQRTTLRLRDRKDDALVAEIAVK